MIWDKKTIIIVTLIVALIILYSIGHDWWYGFMIVGIGLGIGIPFCLLIGKWIK